MVVFGCEEVTQCRVLSLPGVSLPGVRLCLCLPEGVSSLILDGVRTCWVFGAFSEDMEFAAPYHKSVPCGPHRWGLGVNIEETRPALTSTLVLLGVLLLLLLRHVCSDSGG